MFATGPSEIRFGDQNVILNPDWPRDRKEWTDYQEHLKTWLRVDGVQVLHTRDWAIADSPSFVAPLKSATGVYLVAGNAGRYTDAYLGTRTQAELMAVLSRGGVIFGSSAGAIVQGSFVVRGRPDKPLLMAPGRTTGFGFLKNVAINPHLTSTQRDAELVNVVDAHPDILGIGIDDDAALLVRKDVFEVIGAGRVAIYEQRTPWRVMVLLAESWGTIDLFEVGQGRAVVSPLQIRVGRAIDLAPPANADLLRDVIGSNNYNPARTITARGCVPDQAHRANCWPPGRR